MKQFKKFKLSLPNTGLMFLIAGMAVANYSYENYQKKYMSSSMQKNVDSSSTLKNESPLEKLEGFLHITEDGQRDHINVSTDDYPHVKSEKLKVQGQNTDRVASSQGKSTEGPSPQRKDKEPKQNKRLEKKIDEGYRTANHL